VLPSLGASSVPIDVDNSDLIAALASGGANNELNSLWLNQTVGPIESCMIPDKTYRSSDGSSGDARICLTRTSNALLMYGVFHTELSVNALNSIYGTGFRLAKTIPQ